MEADMAMTQQAMGRGNDPCYAEFYYFPMEDKARSLEEGRPIYKEVEFVKIMVPGDKDNIVERPVREKDKQRFFRQYQAFQAKQEQPMEGTLLSDWPGVSRAQVEELRHFGVHTVEQLAGIPDSTAQKFLGINRLKGKAADYIATAKGEAPLEQLRAENEQLRAEIEAIKAQMDLPKRGRPRKEGTNGD